MVGKEPPCLLVAISVMWAVRRSAAPLVWLHAHGARYTATEGENEAMPKWFELNNTELNRRLDQVYGRPPRIPGKTIHCPPQNVI